MWHAFPFAPVASTSMAAVHGRHMWWHFDEDAKKGLLSPLQACIADVLIVAGPDGSDSVMGPLGQSRHLDLETLSLRHPSSGLFCLHN